MPVNDNKYPKFTGNFLLHHSLLLLKNFNIVDKVNSRSSDQRSTIICKL